MVIISDAALGDSLAHARDPVLVQTQKVRSLLVQDLLPPRARSAECWRTAQRMPAEIQRRRAP